MLEREFKPQARLAQHLKDVKVILDTGLTVGANLPMSAVHEKLLEELVQAGNGDLHNNAIIKAFRSAE